MGQNIELPGQSHVKVDINRETVKARDAASAEKSNWFLKTSGQEVTPAGCEYVGSFASHIYRDRMDPLKFVTIAVTPIGLAHEVWCDVAHKELKTVLMEKFNRKAPSKRK